MRLLTETSNAETRDMDDGVAFWVWSVLYVDYIWNHLIADPSHHETFWLSDINLIIKTKKSNSKTKNSANKSNW